MDSSPREPLAEGVFLGGYRIMQRLAEGRFWDVYQARASSTRRIVALKILHEDVPEDRLRRFLVKANELCGFEHPHSARIIEAGQDAGTVFLAQEYIEGPRGRALSLADELRNHGGCLPEDTVRLRARQLWEGICAGHAFRNEQNHWGGELLADALLTPQHRVKLLAPALRQILAGESPVGAEGTAADVRAFGEFLHTALTGCPAVDQPPSSFGVPRAWDRVVAACRQAAPGVLPDEGAIHDGLMTAGRSSNRIKWLIPAAVLILLAAVVPVVRELQNRSRPTPEQLAAAEAAREASETEQQVGKFLTAAEAAMAQLEFAKARKVVEHVLSVVPDHPKAKALLEDIDRAEGMTRVGPVKTKAEDAWSQVRDLPDGQGVGARLTAAKQALDRARLALTSNRFDDARKDFEAVLSIAGELQALDMARDRAAQTRARCMAARQSASEGDSAAFAGGTWAKAEAADNGAREAFDKGDFVAAATGWRQAEEMYVEAEREAVGRQEAEQAKDEYSRRVVDVRESDLDVPAEVLKVAATKNEEAKGLLAKRQWRQAAASWRDGATLLATAHAKVAESRRQQNYQEAMAQGRKLLAEREYGKAEAAFARALAEPGRGADPEAMKLFEQVRASRFARESKKAWRDKDGNLVYNSGFELGKDGIPEGWTKPDNLTVFWDRCGFRGMGLHLDTDVYRSEWEAHRKNPDEPMVKTKTTGTRYNTVGGTTGVAVYSRPIPVEPDAYYQVEFDIRGQGEPFVFIKGFWKCGPQDLDKMGKKMFFKPFKPGPSYSLMAMGTSGQEKRDPHPGDYIQCYRRRLVARLKDPKEWRHFRTVVHFEAAQHIEVVLLELYAFWPPGDYYYDNVGFRKVTKEEADAYEAWRRKLGEDANHGVPSRSVK
jgi:hypothetical protein